VERIEPNLRGAFIDLTGASGSQAFLPVKGGQRLHEGEKVEVEVVSERRETKGVTLKLRGKRQGEPRLLAPGPSVRDWLERFAPGVEPIEGAKAIEAGWSALGEAMEQPFVSQGPVVSIERTRAMITADFDYMPPAGRRAAPQDRLGANRRGLKAVARTLRLRSLGGLVAIDLIGAAQDSDALLKTSKAEFGADPEIVYGPINRFGVMMLSLPWRFQPLEERLFRHPKVQFYDPLQGAVEATRRLRHALLSDTTAPRVTVRCPVRTAELAAPLVARLGPRAHVLGDHTLTYSQFVLETQ
jgi:hypothetical protein